MIEIKSNWYFLKQRNKYTVFLWVAAFLWMLFIFFLSSQPAPVSNGLSKKVTMVFIDIAKQVKEIDIASLNHVGEINNKVRDYMHIFVYIILVIIVVNALRSIGMGMFISSVLALFISVAFACSDEIHQMYVPGRAMQAEDFLRDCAGVVLGLTIYNISVLLYKSANFFKPKRRH
ncbi:VanZ family protein [Desulfocucumis palustris]|uniref:VanZ family protein n=1 Tax=Desulfocucumis palustris TaxID=1898651 RepID=UPI000CEA4BDD|nr:VanZ family protein [Desulfocucumis palustris]